MCSDYEVSWEAQSLEFERLIVKLLSIQTLVRTSNFSIIKLTIGPKINRFCCGFNNGYLQMGVGTMTFSFILRLLCRTFKKSQSKNENEYFC